MLDATKHQDDKINRLLTTVAFLTAAALALAGLAMQRTVVRHLPGRRPVRAAAGHIGLGGFLAGVTVSVIMLMVSITTPLVLPGGTNPVTPDIRVRAGAEDQSVYFNEISETALPGWYTRSGGRTSLR